MTGDGHRLRIRKGQARVGNSMEWKGKERKGKERNDGHQGCGEPADRSEPDPRRRTGTWRRLPEQAAPGGTDGADRGSRGTDCRQPLAAPTAESNTHWLAWEEEILRPDGRGPVPVTEHALWAAPEGAKLSISCTYAPQEFQGAGKCETSTSFHPRDFYIITPVLFPRGQALSRLPGECAPRGPSGDPAYVP